MTENEMKSAVLTPTSQKIDRLIRRIEEGDIKIPAFQRGYVWNQSQVIELLESIVAEYPIGSILLWSTDEKLKSTRNIAGYLIPDRGDNYPVNYALDGQQRLASIFGVFSNHTVQESDTAAYNPNINIFEISYNFDDELFVSNSDLNNTRNTIPLRSLLDVTKLIDALQHIDSKFHTTAQDLSSKFLNYEVPVVTIENRNREDVGIIFERINNTGTKLGPLDLMTAWTWTDDFHLMEASDELLEIMESKGFGGINSKVLLQVISGVIQETTIGKNILSLSGEQVRDNWDRISESLKKTIDFLATELKCKHIDFLPFSQQLVPMAVFFDRCKKPSEAQLAELKRYFWKTSFSDRYSSGQSSKKMDGDIQAAVRLVNGNLASFASYQYTVSDRELSSVKFSKANATTRAFLLLMAQYDPIDLVKAQKIDLGKSLSIYNRKEYHHVFPKAFLKQQGVTTDELSSIMNFCFLSSESNKKISASDPKAYMLSLVPQASFKEIMSSNVLPVDVQLYSKNDYRLFVEKRAEEVLSRIDAITS